MKRCFVYAAGTFYGLRERPREGDLQIAADAGLRLCRQAGLRPDLVLGDFDSMDVSEAPADCIRVPVEKDDTDSMLALREGLKRGCDEFYLYGATGGARLDHTLSNLQSLAFLRHHGAHGYLYDRNFVYTVIENETLTLTREVEWGIVSLFSMGSAAEHITLSGLQYPLTDAMLTCDFPLGVSNHFIAPEARISVGRGPLLVGWELKKQERFRRRGQNFLRHEARNE